MSEHMNDAEFLASEGVEATPDLSYIPMPNVGDAVLSRRLAPDHSMRTTFVFPFLDQDTLIFTHHRRRGVEVPGGHREIVDGEWETPEVAVRRELQQETGSTVGTLIPVGAMRSRSQAEMPEGYEYPFPTAAQQFFAARIESISLPYVENDECLKPRLVSHADVMDRLDGRARALYLEARRVMFPHLVTEALLAALQHPRNPSTTERSLQDDLASTIEWNLRLYDWPWSWSEMERQFGSDLVAMIAAIVELRRDGKLRRIEIAGKVYFEIP